MSKYVFEIEFNCTNCGREWKEQFTKGHVVRRSGFGGDINVYRDHGWIRTIKCPTCDSEAHVIEEKRCPLENENEI